MRPRILLCRTLHPAGTAVLAARPEFEVVTIPDPPPEAFRQHLSTAAAVLCWLERVDRAALDAAPHLRVVSRYGVGFDTVDLAACAERGIPVMVTNGANDLSVAEHALMLMLAVARRAVDAHQEVRAGGWWPATGPGMVDLAGRRVLVVGWGRIGARVAALCQAFGMHVTVLDPGFHPARIAAAGFRAARTLEAALPEADVLTLHCPLGAATRHMINARALALLPAGAIVVNTARGGIIDEAALVEALRAGRLHGAGLDVLEVEPAAGTALLSLPNVVVSPHNAASTEQGLARMAAAAARNILDALDGHPDPAMMVCA